MSIEGQGHFFTIYFPGFVSFMLYMYLDKISGERLQDHWSSGYLLHWKGLFLTGHSEKGYQFQNVEHTV